jgi:predicted nucleic acid-binding protein
MGGLTVGDLCRRHRRIGLDSNVLIFAIEGIQPWSRFAGELVDAIESGACSGTLSALALAEILSGPARAGDWAQVERYADELRSLRGLSVGTVSAELAGDAAVIAAARGLSLADATHLASARAAGATAFVTNDRGIHGSARLEVVYLDEIA